MLLPALMAFIGDHFVLELLQGAVQTMTILLLVHRLVSATAS